MSRKIAPKVDSSRLRIFVAHREIVLIRKPRARGVVIRMRTNGEIHVFAGVSVTSERLHEFMWKHHDWIESIQRRHEELRRLHPRKRYVSGELFLFRGEMLPLEFRVSHEVKAAVASVAEKALIISIPHRQWSSFDSGAEHPEFARVIADFYRREARVLISKRLAHYAVRMNVEPMKVTFRRQRTRWGSCTPKHHLSMNWCLIIAPLEVIDYVCVHELAHLRHHNHSAAFWKFVETEAPTYKSSAAWLHKMGYETDFLLRRSGLHPGLAES